MIFYSFWRYTSVVASDTSQLLEGTPFYTSHQQDLELATWGKRVSSQAVCSWHDLKSVVTIVARSQERSCSACARKHP
eukprot:12267717-Heterocapsa_arctica.AAC.1